MEVKSEDSKEDAASWKVFPPWMIRQGMDLTNDQYGEVKKELILDNISSLVGPATDKNPAENNKGNV